MTGALAFLAIGLLLIAILILALSRPKTTANPDSAIQQDEDLMPAAFAEVFPQQLGDRLFGAEDWNFIVKQRSDKLRRLFLQQRTALALSWLHGVKFNAEKLMRAHRAAARSNSQLRPLVELRVTGDYLLFKILCQLTVLVIWLRGPVDLTYLIAYIDDLSEQLSEVIVKFLPPELASATSKREPYLTSRGRRMV